jgi:hypothetical protein
MKRFGIFLTFASLVLCQALSAVEKTAAPNTKAGGVRAEEKAVAAKVLRGALPNTKSIAKFLVVRIETRMEGGKQKFTATASVHTGTQAGAPAAVDHIWVRITQPTKSSNTGTSASKATATGSVDAADGKFRTVVADAVILTKSLEDTKVAVTVPGDR